MADMTKAAVCFSTKEPWRRGYVSDCQALSAHSNAVQALMERASRWLIQRPGWDLELFPLHASWRFVLHESLQAEDMLVF